MPSTSKKQRNFMAAAAHNPAFAKKVGISQKVAKEFNQADKGKKFRGGGMAKCKKMADGGLSFAEMDESDRSEAARKAIEDLNARQAEKSAAASAAAPVKRAPKSKPVNRGSVVENLADLESQGVDTGYDATERARNARKTQTRHFSGRPTAMKKGGSVRGCGAAIKGKTRGRMV